MHRASRERGINEMLEELREILAEAEEGDRPAGDLRAVLDLHALLETMRKSGIPFVVVGAHALGAYTDEKRDTKDLDVVSKDWRKLRTAVAKAFPALSSTDEGDAVRFTKEGREFLDVLKPRGVYALVLASKARSHVLGVEVSVPDREVLLATKYAAGISPHRTTDKVQQDEVDFMRVVRAAPSLNRAKLRRAGEAVYSGGGDDLLRLIDLAKDAKKRFSFFEQGS